MTAEATTLLGFPFPEVADPRRLCSGDDALDRRLLQWLDLYEGERDVQRVGERCVLVDRGRPIEETTSRGYGDSLRKVLQIAIDVDAAERILGRRLEVGE